eukprot:GEMP01007325.1.p1 GENE.GEMP01007325.1~~GEMP01007325.1.p1  ORF type:complete len:961 (+),score=211.75 GEMP01007325.1:157-3039(+)
MRDVRGVVMEIRRLYEGAHAAEATAHLQQWQQSSACTWEAITQLIQYPDELVAFFGANTAVTKAQLGGGCNGEQILDRIIQINGASGAAIRRQLCTAYADLAMYGHASLQVGVQRLSDDGLLELLVAFPEEARNVKVLVSHDARLRFISMLLSNQAEVFDVIATKGNVSKVLSAADQWLNIPSPAVLAARDSGAKFTAEIFRKQFYEHPLIRLACENMLTQNAEQATGVLSSLLALTNEYSPVTVDAIRVAWEATAALAQKLSPNVDPDGWLPYDPNDPNREEIIVRLTHISRLISEWGCLWYRGLAQPSEWHTRIGDVALHWMTLRHCDIARGGLDFWYSVLATHSQDNKVFDQELAPWLENFVKKCLVAVRFPREPEKHDDFEIEMFVRIRDQCSSILTEAANVISPQWIIQVVGDQVTPQGAWNDLDASVFVLTGVAPRAHAGKDAVIPELIRLIPNFSYPSTGLAAILLRVASARLILYTAGYLASEREPLIISLDFLLTNLLPSLPAIEVDNKDLKQYAEALCADAIKVVSFTARMQILGLVPADLGGGETFWPAVVTQIMNLIVNTAFNVEVRGQLCVALGQLLISLPDLEEMEQALIAFVGRLEPPADIPKPADGKTPPELKVYLSAFTSMSTFEQRSMMADQTSHPVLRIWERSWNNLEKYAIMAVQNDYEDWLEQLCMSLTFVFGHSRSYVTQNSFFTASLTMLGKAAAAKPLNCYYSLLKSTMGIFAPIGDPQLDVTLVEFLGMYAVPVARQLQNNFPPDVVANCYEMLGDSLRWSNLANGALKAEWLPDVFDPAIAVLEQNNELSTHEKALSSILRFFCSFIRWSTEGPEIVQLSKPLWEGGRVPKMVNICVELMRRSSENPSCSTVPAVADVLRPLLNGSMEFETKSCLKQALMALPPPLAKSSIDAHRLVDVFSMEKVDARRFGKQVFDTVCEFHGALKRATEAGGV